MTSLDHSVQTPAQQHRNVEAAVEVSSLDRAMGRYAEGHDAAFGEVFRERCVGWRVYVFTGNQNLGREIGLRPGEQIPLFNGKIACKLLRFDL